MTNRTVAAPAVQSRHWYRVRDLCPRWHAQLTTSRHALRTGVWMIVGLDGVRHRVRLNEASWAIVGRCDGHTTLDAIWRHVARAHPERVPPQADVINVVSSLVNDGLLICGDWPDLKAGLDADADANHKERRERLNPLAPRVSLGSPQALIDRLSGLAHFLFSPSGAGLAGLLLLIAGFIGLTNWQALSADWRQTFYGWQSWWLIAVCYIPLKAIHELAHGLALRRYDGPVRDAGIGFLMGMPAPYVDASAADDFAKPAERAWVSAAGVFAEVVCAALAVIAWSIANDGVIRDICLAIATIGGVSTLLFNGNPLIRLDGYYVMTDCLRLPRLAEESRAHWQGLWRTRVLGMADCLPMAAPPERLALTLYAPAAWLYRAGLMFWLSTWVAQASRVGGLLIALVAVTWLIVTPLVRLAQTPIEHGASFAVRIRAWVRLGMVMGAVLAASFIPAPDRVWLDAVVWHADNSRVRNTDAGFIDQIHVVDGEVVTEGQALISLSDPDLDAEIERMEAVVQERARAWTSRLQTRQADSAQARERLHQAEQSLADLLARRQRFTITAHTVGRVRFVEPTQNLLSRFLDAGSLIAVIETRELPQLSMLIDQPTLARLNAPDNAPQVFAVDARKRLAPATITRRPTRAVNELPHPAFARALGGHVTAHLNDRKTWLSRTELYPMKLVLDKKSKLQPDTRTRVLVSFGWRPLAQQWWENVRDTIDPKIVQDWS